MDNAPKHHQLASVLLEREVIYTEDVEHIFGKRPWISRSQEILDIQEKAAEIASSASQEEAEAKLAESGEENKETIAD